MTPIENGVSTPTIKEDNEIAEMDNIIGINEDKPKGENEGGQKVGVFLENIKPTLGNTKMKYFTLDVTGCQSSVRKENEIRIRPLFMCARNRRVRFEG